MDAGRDLVSQPRRRNLVETANHRRLADTRPLLKRQGGQMRKQLLGFCIAATVMLLVYGILWISHR